MPSRKSNPKLPLPPSLWKEELASSEARLAEVAAELARELGPTDRVILEGEMGTGKSTFARALLGALGIEQPAEGSPSFAIAHEYRARRGDVIHLDLYRLRSEQEIEDAGVSEYFWGRDAVVIVEWLSLFPGFGAQVLKAREGSRCWRVDLAIASGESRDLRIRQG